MKDGLNYALFGTVVAVAAGLIGAYGLPDISQTETSSFASAYMLGHVTYTVTDENGNIKAYRQLDNIIVDQGEDCAATLLFTNVTRGGTVADPATTGTEVVPDKEGANVVNTCFAITQPYVHIAIGNGSAGLNSAAGDDTDLVNEHLESEDPGIGLSRVSDSRPVFTAATGSTPAKVVLSKDFTLTLLSPGIGTPQVVNESGLFNSSAATAEPTGFNTAGIGMFARQTFADVTIASGETLTVEWTINIGGTGTITTGTEET